ncbi:hypothetical protein [Mycobacterium sp. URHB0021]
MGEINPGNAVRVKAAFDVPPDTQATDLVLHDSMFSGGATAHRPEETHSPIRIVRPGCRTGGAASTSTWPLPR